MTRLRVKTAEMLRSHQTIHPISYNHYFIENIQEIRARHLRDRCASIVRSHFNVSDLEGVSCETSTDLSNMVDDLIIGFTEPDMNRVAATEALNYMEAYYKVCHMKRVILEAEAFSGCPEAVHRCSRRNR